MLKGIQLYMLLYPRISDMKTQVWACFSPKQLYMHLQRKTRSKSLFLRCCLTQLMLNSTSRKNLFIPSYKAFLYNSRMESNVPTYIVLLSYPTKEYYYAP